jgi:hypothetical protein
MGIRGMDIKALFGEKSFGEWAFGELTSYQINTIINWTKNLPPPTYIHNIENVCQPAYLNFKLM